MGLNYAAAGRCQARFKLITLAVVFYMASVLMQSLANCSSA
jgi:hypothetical protein